MDETTSNEGASEGNQPAAGEAGVSGDGATGTQAPEGFVPRAELDALREETRRMVQSERDKLRVEFERLTAPAGDASGDAAASGASSESLTQADIARIISVQTALPTLRQEFPHADPAFFEADHALSYGSVTALRMAAQASHDRVASILEAERPAVEQRLREEFAKANPGAAGPANGGGTEGGTGDPTPAQLAAMSMDELDELEKANPGVLDRVLRSATK